MCLDVCFWIQLSADYIRILLIFPLKQNYPYNKFALQGKLDVCKTLIYFKMGAAWEETDQGERMHVGGKFKILSQAKRSDLQY